MGNHSIDQGLCEFAHPRCCRTKLPKLIDLVRTFATLKIAPEMILDRSFSGSATFTHYPSAVWKPPLLVLLRTSDKTFAISTAARAASVPRLILFSRQRARAR